MAVMIYFVCLISISVGLTGADSSSTDFMKREHSLIKPYQGAKASIHYWDFHGATIVSNNYVRLTQDVQSTQGGLWNSVPCMATAWELQVQVKIHGHGKELYGDGMALWYTRERMAPGPVFGSKDHFEGLAIIIDTYSNHNGEHNHGHPYISAMVNNGTLHYDHDRDGTHTELAGCEAKLRNVHYDTSLAIRYEQDVLSVLTDVDNKGEWKECFRVKGVRLPTGYHFGASAATGDLSDNHDILAIRLYEIDNPKVYAEDRSKIIPSAEQFEPPREHIDDLKPSWSGTKLFLILLVCSILLLVAAIGGYMYYQQYQEKSLKRFY